MKKDNIYDIIDLEVRWDILNNNLLISTAMLSAYWEKEKKDIFDLMMPFVKYSIAKTTPVNSYINLDEMTSFFKKEFGYETMPMHVFAILLGRLSPDILAKSKGKYRLKKALDEDITKFEKGHALFESHRSKVADSLVVYLNNKQVFDRSYTPETAMSALIDFFASNGMLIFQDAERLELLKRKDNRQKYFIAQFIIEEYKKKTDVFSYIEDMVKGFFVSSALSIQPKNGDVVKSNFQELKCYLDTRIIINALGLHLPEEKKSSLELLKMLTEKGATLLCFEHTVQEIESIINAYRASLNNPRGSSSMQTLEDWDNQCYTVSDVDRYLLRIRDKISRLGISIEEKPVIEDVQAYPFNDSDLIDHIDETMYYNNHEAIVTDVQSIISIFLLRKGDKNPRIEKSKYVFVTSNHQLTNVVNSFLIKNKICNPHRETMPIVSDVDLSSIVWLKCYSSHKDYPRQKLIEQSLIALEPTHTMLDAFFAVIDRLIYEGGITEDEAAIIRTDAFCKRELSNIARGNSDSISTETVFAIREKLRARYIGEENSTSDLNYQKYLEQKKNNRLFITNAISEIEKVGKETFESTKRVGRCITRASFFILFIGLLVITLFNLKLAPVPISTGILSFLGFLGTIDMFRSKKSIIYRIIDIIAHNIADKAKDAKRAEYEKVFGGKLYLEDNGLSDEE